MGRRLRREEVMPIEVLHERGMSNRAIARQLGVHEHAVRYEGDGLRSSRRGLGTPYRSGGVSARRPRAC